MLPFLLRALVSGLFSGEYSYVVRGATIRCDCGTDPGVLNLPTCHGVYIKEKPVMNITDSLPQSNISCFGFCKKTNDLCIPLICAKWTDGKEDVLLDNEPALLSKSKLTCLRGGVISIETDGQD
ncbi:DUF4280 domain-containing protein [Paenibacillus apiarius]|uniref:DUF4280 domain-containing protein n=1 Tax=Paenibacillus apiarius TaxID=46240 RepID=UPI003B3B7F84